MKHLIAFLLFLLVSVSLIAQQTIGKLNNGESFTNTSDKIIFYMPRSKVVKLLNYQTKAEFDSIRVEKFKELVGNMELRIMEADSAISLRSNEAEYWKMQLNKNDRELEQAKIQKETLLYENNRIRKSRLYYFIGGIVATSIVYIAIK